MGRRRTRERQIGKGKETAIELGCVRESERKRCVCVSERETAVERGGERESERARERHSERETARARE